MLLKVPNHDEPAVAWQLLPSMPSSIAWSVVELITTLLSTNGQFRCYITYVRVLVAKFKAHNKKKPQKTSRLEPTHIIVRIMDVPVSKVHIYVVLEVYKKS